MKKACRSFFQVCQTPGTRFTKQKIIQLWIHLTSHCMENSLLVTVTLEHQWRGTKTLWKHPSPLATSTTVSGLCKQLIMRSGDTQSTRPPPSWKTPKGVPLVAFMYLVFTHMPGESDRRQFWSLLRYLSYIFWALINSLLCWFWHPKGQHRVKEYKAEEPRPFSIQPGPDLHPQRLWQSLSVCLSHTYKSQQSLACLQQMQTFHFLKLCPQSQVQ